MPLNYSVSVTNSLRFRVSCHLDVASLLNQMTIDLVRFSFVSQFYCLPRQGQGRAGQGRAEQGSTCAPNVLVCSFISVQEDKLNLRIFPTGATGGGNTHARQVLNAFWCSPSCWPSREREREWDVGQGEDSEAWALTSRCALKRFWSTSHTFTLTHTPRRTHTHTHV